MYFITFILKNLARRPVRSALTIVGVGVAVGAFVALVGISRGFEKSYNQLYEQRGVDLVVVRAGITERLASSIDQRVAEHILAIPGVAKVTGGLMDTASFEREGLIGVPVQGWGHGSFLFDELVLLAGRRFGEGEKKVVMLGAILAKNLGKSAGDRVEMLSEEFQVVGVYQSFNVFENGSAIVPLEELQRLMDRPGRVTGFQVVLQNAPDREQLRQQVRQQIEALCNEAGEPLRLSALPAREYVKSTFQIQLSRTQAWVTSLLALIIGAIGMLNTMIMSVFEQTREIGILRAIGWRRGRIMRMILGEALVLCLCGAILGTLAAVLQVRWLASLARASGYIEGHTPAEIIAAGFAIALIVGVLGGLYPAVRAARLLPTEAIRHE